MKNLKKVRRICNVGWLVTLSVAMTAAANAEVLFSSSKTGAELAAIPTVSLYGASPDVVGVQLTIGISSANGTVLSWPILSPGSYGRLRVDVAVDYSMVTGDMDIGFGLRDGGTEIFLRRYDGGNANLLRLYERSAGNLSSTNLTNLGVQAPSGPQKTFNMTFELDPVTMDISIYGEQNGRNETPFDFSGSPSAGLNFTEGGLDFIVVGQNGSERYGIDRVTVSISTMPEAESAVRKVPLLPPAFLLLLALLAGYGGFVRIKK